MALINQPPINGPLVNDKGFALNSLVQWAGQVYRLCFDVQNSGTTAQRPTTALYVGKPYFDVTLGIPVWWVGPLATDWCDATGAPA